MFDTMFEVKKDSSTGLFCVKPLRQDELEPYIIVFESENKAKEFCVRLTMGQAASPLESPAQYSFKGVHPDGVTQLLAIKN